LCPCGTKKEKKGWKVTKNDAKRRRRRKEGGKKRRRRAPEHLGPKHAQGEEGLNQGQNHYGQVTLHQGGKALYPTAEKSIKGEVNQRRNLGGHRGRTGGKTIGSETKIGGQCHVRI